jgi:uncharacterized iron-regulated protein
MKAPAALLLAVLAAPARAAAPAPASASALAQLLELADVATAPVAVPGARRVLAAGEPCLFDGRTGLPADAARALARAAASDVVYAGEKHDSAAHHALQRQLLERLAAARPGAGAAFEMLYASQQDALDRYLSGATSDDEFQAQVDWKKTWGFPFALYKPVFDALRAGSRRGAALNVPKAIVHKVAETGLASLTPEERAQVPADFKATTDPAYLAMLGETFAAHGGDPADAAGLSRFVDAMSLWNEGMASHLAEFLARRPGGPVLVVAGAFHAYAAGMPASLARRRPGASQTAFVFLDAASCPTRLPPSAGLDADYLWVNTP